MSDQPFAPPESDAVSADAERIRRAGEAGFLTLILFAANACCGLLVFVVPITGAMALIQIQGLVPRTEVDHLWRRLALTGGWMGVLLGGVLVLIMLAYLAFLAAVLAAPGFIE